MGFSGGPETTDVTKASEMMWGSRQPTLSRLPPQTQHFRRPPRPPTVTRSALLAAGLVAGRGGNYPEVPIRPTVTGNARSWLTGADQLQVVMSSIMRFDHFGPQDGLVGDQGLGGLAKSLSQSIAGAGGCMRS